MIPVIIVLTENYPISAPRVILSYLLDKASAQSNPLLKSGGEVMNKYIASWNGRDQQFNLGSLILNLSKSFSMYPPLGSGAGGALNTDVIYFSSDDTRPLPDKVIKEEYKVDKAGQEIPTHSYADYEEQKKVDEKMFFEETANNERKELVFKVAKKVKAKLDNLDSVQTLESTTSSSSNKDMFTQAKEYLEDNATKLK
jgi:UEV domain